MNVEGKEPLGFKVPNLSQSILSTQIQDLSILNSIWITFLCEYASNDLDEQIRNEFKCKLDTLGSRLTRLTG